MKRSLVPTSAGAAVRAVVRPSLDALRAAGIEDSALNAYQNRLDRKVKGWMHHATATGDLLLATSDADAATDGTDAIDLDAPSDSHSTCDAVEWY